MGGELKTTKEIISKKKLGTQALIEIISFEKFAKYKPKPVPTKCMRDCMRANEYIQKHIEQGTDTEKRWKRYFKKWRMKL